MIKLKEVILDKYKVFTSPQTVRIEDDVTALVGMNESGKTAFLEVLAKINFFDQNSSFHFNPLSDFPRHELKKFEGKIDELEVAICKFAIKDKLAWLIANDIGEKTLPENFFYFGAKYNNWQVWKDFPVDVKAFLKFNLRNADIDESVNSFIESVNDFSEIPEKVEIVKNPVIRKSLIDLFNYISGSAYPWPDPLKGYIAKKWFRPHLPLFWYFDEYYSLPSRINLNKLVESDDSDESFSTSKALFKLAKIDVNELLHTDNFEKFISELENTANLITEKIYSYWSTNKNLELEFEIEIEHHKKKVGEFFKNSEHYEERYLNIRIRDKYNRVSLPLNRRSKGFNWFFSVIVWFSQIEKKKNVDYVLLLDEPGLNLHAVAQADLLKFIKDLAVDYQVIYTTHSPFMLSNEDLQKVRTIADFQDGSVISEVKNETDPETLFPIQVAIGYDIAQNLLVKKRNLVVESVPDFILLNLFNDYFKAQNELTLSDTIAITPLGGFSNVIKFITLMSGYNLNLVVLSPKNNLHYDNNLIGKVNSLGVDKLLSYAEFIGDDAVDNASIFDLFAHEDFLKIVTEVSPSLKGILLPEDITHPYLKSFNSTFPTPVTEIGLASYVSRKGIERHLPETFENFRQLFEKVNFLFGIKS